MILWFFGEDCFKSRPLLHMYIFAKPSKRSVLSIVQYLSGFEFLILSSFRNKLAITIYVCQIY